MNESNEDYRDKETVKSESDDRTVNNVVRHEYKVLNDNEKLDMKNIKDIGAEFIKQLNTVRSHSGEPKNCRELDIAQEKAEEAVMWAVKHITK